MNTPPRIGIVPYTNTIPLEHYLPQSLPQASMIREVPSKLAQLLANGEIDIAMLSSIELLRHPEYRYIPGIGICGDGTVKSVRLFTEKTPWDVTSVALDQSSLSSIMMTRIIYKHHWNIQPEFVSFSPPIEKGLQVAEAAISIGDPTFQFSQPGIHHWDMGEVWKKFSQKPFIYALWITRPGIDPEEYAPAFHEAKQRGTNDIERLAHLCAQRFSQTPAFYYEYLTNNIYYDVGQKELEGMHSFFQLAKPFLDE